MKLTTVTILCLLLAACSTQPEQKKAAESAPEPEKKAAAPNPLGTPEVFKVRFETSKGPFVVEVHRDWAPKGVDRFHELIKANYFNDARFFRVIPNFVAQFGIAASPAVTKKWDKMIDDDPVTHGNGYGTITFATRRSTARASPRSAGSSKAWISWRNSTAATASSPTRTRSHAAAMPTLQPASRS
jgi:peptidyl-prolyl cis-trans isomerase A (cyclophilin A)